MSGQENAWRPLDRDAPDWTDGGEIEVRRADGSTALGVLASDAGFDGEDEFPIWTVTLMDGSEVSLFDFTDWRVAQRKDPAR